MNRIWQWQEAQDKFSEVVEDAVAKGLQIITRDGKCVAVVLSFGEYSILTRYQQPLSSFFQESPLASVELDLTRDTSPIRDDLAP